MSPSTDENTPLSLAPAMGQASGRNDHTGGNNDGVLSPNSGVVKRSELKTPSRKQRSPYPLRSATRVLTEGSRAGNGTSLFASTSNGDDEDYDSNEEEEEETAVEEAVEEDLVEGEELLAASSPGTLHGGSNYEARLEGVKSDETAMAQNPVDLQKAMFDEAGQEVVPQFDDKTMKEFVTHASDAGNDLTMAAAHDKKMSELEDPLDASLQVQSLKKVSKLGWDALQGFRTATKTSGASALESTLMAEGKLPKLSPPRGDSSNIVCGKLVAAVAGMTHHKDGSKTKNMQLQQMQERAAADSTFFANKYNTHNNQVHALEEKLSAAELAASRAQDAADEAKRLATDAQNEAYRLQQVARQLSQVSGQAGEDYSVALTKLKSIRTEADSTLFANKYNTHNNQVDALEEKLSAVELAAGRAQDAADEAQRLATDAHYEAYRLQQVARQLRQVSGQASKDYSVALTKLQSIRTDANACAQNNKAVIEMLKNDIELHTRGFKENWDVHEAWFPVLRED